ncbi:hypothetical protein MLD52_18545 [Puniceicoccaceae bacterium K14]|nr:hypothetical protein [Puniceicoccaceae bacterium K14]
MRITNLLPQINKNSFSKKKAKLATSLFVFSSYILAYAENVSPFALDKSGDNGYYSFNSTASTGLNSALEDTPFAVDVLNSEFLSDVGVNDFGNAADIMLISPRLNVTKLGFALADWSLLVDLHNVERIDFSRGTEATHSTTGMQGVGIFNSYNSYSYNFSSPGHSGIANFTPIMPTTGESYYKFSLADGDDGYFSSSIDTSASIFKDEEKGTLSYRLAATYSKEDFPNNSNQREYYTGQLLYVSPKWNVFVEGQLLQPTIGLYRDIDFGYEYIDWLATIDYLATENLTVSAGAFVQTSDFVSSELDYAGFDLSGRTDEYRLNLNYTFNSPDFFKSSTAKHSFLAGINERTNKDRPNTNGTYLTYEGEYLDGRATFVASIRRDSYRRLLGVDYSNDGSLSFSEILNEKSETLAFGYQLNSHASAYINYSSGRDKSNGDPIRFREIGIKFNAFDKKLNGRIGFFEKDKKYAFTSRTSIYNSGTQISDSTEVMNAIRAIEPNNYYAANPLETENVEISWRDYIETAFANSDSSTFSSYGSTLYIYSDTYKPETNQGIDLKLTYSPTKNLDVTLNFHRGDYSKDLERETLYTYAENDTVEIVKTSYDDYSNSSVTNYNQNTGTLLAKYQFTENFLQGLSLIAGTVYGGTITSENLESIAYNYPTPRSPERFEYRLGARYTWEMAKATWSLQINIENLADETEKTTYVEYTNLFDGVTEVRRSTFHYEPRTYRARLSVEF